MKLWMKMLGGTVLALALLGAMLAVGALATATWHPALIEINGEPLEWAQFGADHWLVGIAGVLVAAVVVMLVVPLAVVLPLLIVGLVLVGVFVALAGVAALVCSPLLLLAGLGWLIWRHGARADAREHAQSDATMAP
jgi:hypothetical protein